MRPNHRLNILDLDTRNQESIKALTDLKLIVAVEVYLYESRKRESAVATIRDVDGNISEAELRVPLRSTAPVT